MKFFKKMSEALTITKLSKVRIKTDPLWAEKLGIRNAPHYEGYVLQETPDSNLNIKVFIVNTPPGYDPVQSVKVNQVEPIEQPEEEKTTEVKKFPSKMTALKTAVFNKLIEMGKDKDSPEIQQILSAKDIGFMESYLKQLGLTDDDLLTLYRKCFTRF